MAEVRVLSATGMLGSGFPAESLERAVSWGPDFIGCDSGSSDFGPFPLASGQSPMPRDAWKRDIRLILHAGRTAGIPVLIGTTGGAGANAHLSWGREIVEEIAHEDGLRFRLATIESELEPDFVARCFEAGRVRPLDPAPETSPERISRAAHIVALMGVEPYQAALDGGADVVLAGRSTDTAIFSAIPLRRGCDPGLVWHAAKLLECGAAPVEHRLRPDCMMGYIRDDHVQLTPPNPALRCTPLSVAAHTLYENGDPFHLYEPSGMLDTTDATYEALDDERSVRIAGARFVPAATHTVKLEATELAGYQAFSVAGIRDAAVLDDLDGFLATCHGRIQARLCDLYGETVQLGRDCSFRYVVYGRNGVMGALEPERSVPGHEVGIVLEATAPTQHLADTLIGLAEYITMHNPVPQWKGFTTNLAFPYAPSHVSRGATYRFALNHVLELDDPLEVFPVEFMDL